MRHVKRAFFAIIIAGLACDQGTQDSAQKTETKPRQETLAAKLERAHRNSGESNISCKEGTDAGITYIGCRWDGDSDAATMWHVDGETVNAINGKALQIVPKLGEPWIKEGPRPAPPGVDVGAGLRVTR